MFTLGMHYLFSPFVGMKINNTNEYLFLLHALHVFGLSASP